MSSKERERERERELREILRDGLATRVSCLFSWLFPVLRASVSEFANPYHDEKGRFTTGPEEGSGGNGGVQEDLETKKGIGIGDHISFIPVGGQRAVTIKVTGKDRGKGSGVSGQRVVNGIVKPGVNHYEVPTGVQTIKSVKSVKSVKSASTSTKEHEKIAAQIAERQRIKNAAAETTGKVTERLAGMKAKVEAAAAAAAAAEAQRARNAIETHEGQPSWQSNHERFKALVAEQVEKRNAEIAAAVNEPSKVVKSIEWNGQFKMSEAVQQGVLNGADALEQAGLKGDHGSIAVKMDQSRNGRYGAYQPGQNQVMMNDKLDTDNAAYTFSHEYGHHLDYFENNRVGGPKMSDDLEFRRLVRATPEWKTLQKDTQGVYTGMGRSRGRAAYLSSWPELFARATAQWTATRSGNTDMLKVLDNRRIDHWSGESFKAIGSYLDRKLAGAGAGRKSVAASGLVTEFYNENHDEKGRFTGPGDVGNKVVEAVKEHGGATLEPVGGADVQEGYAVGLGTVHPGTEHNSSAASFTAKDVKNWLKSDAVKEVFKSNPNAKIGVWEDEGKIYLEPSEQVMDRGKAIELGKERNQIGIQHLVPGGEGYISTGGTGEQKQEKEKEKHG